MVRVDGAAEGDRHLLAAREALHELAADALETGLVDLAAGLLGVEALGLDSEFLLGVLLVAEDEVATFHEGGHDLGGGLAVLPEFLAVIEVAGDLHAHLVGDLDRLEASVGGALAQGRGDAGPVEPVGPFEDLVPVDHTWLDLGDGGMGTVIDDLGAAGDGTGLEIVDAHPVTAIDDAVGAHAEAAEFREAHVGDVVLRKTGHELGVDTVVGKGNGHVGLAAAEGGIELVGLREAQVSRSGEAKHHFAEGNYFRHGVWVI